MHIKLHNQLALHAIPPLRVGCQPACLPFAWIHHTLVCLPFCTFLSTGSMSRSFPPSSYVSPSTFHYLFIFFHFLNLFAISFSVTCSYSLHSIIWPSIFYRVLVLFTLLQLLLRVQFSYSHSVICTSTLHYLFISVTSLSYIH